jgi:hypothetical protein
MRWKATPGTSETTVYTVPTGKTLVMAAIRVANNDSADHHAFVSLVPSGETAGNGNRIIPGDVVPANGVIADSDPHVLTAGDFISVKADDAAVTFRLSGALFG